MQKIQLIIPILLFLCLTANTQTNSSSDSTSAASNTTASANASANVTAAASNVSNNETAAANVSSNETASANVSSNASSNASLSADVKTLLDEIIPIGLNIMTNATFALDNKTLENGYPYLWPQPHTVNLTNNSAPLIISPSVFFNYNLTQQAGENASDFATMNKWVSEVIFQYLEIIYEDLSLFTDFNSFQQDQQNQNTTADLNLTNSSMQLLINISNDTKGVFDFNTSEIFTLEISQDLISIKADTYFGFVRAMETLSQIIIRVTPDEFNNLVQGMSFNDTNFANVTSANSNSSADVSASANSNSSASADSNSSASASANASENSTAGLTQSDQTSNLSEVDTVNNDFLKCLQHLQPAVFDDPRFAKLNAFIHIEPAVVPALLHIILNAPLNIRGTPEYPYRGVYLDSGRRFIPVQFILHTIDVMMYNKLNVLHWHLYDSESISFSPSSNPRIGEFGAFSALELYSLQDIEDVVTYAIIHGVRVIPEVSGPAYSASLGVSPDFSDILACADKPVDKYFKYCKYPPCGQLDPLNNKTYSVLGGILDDYTKMFPDGLINMGQDDVSLECWNAKPSIASANMGLSELLSTFRTQEMAVMPVGKDGIFQWLNGKSFIQDGMIMQYRASANGMQDWLNAYPTNQVIFSPADVLQLTSGTGNILGGPATSGVFRTWLDIYNMDLNLTEAFKGQVLGGEIVLWSVIANYNTMDGKYWMRTAAMAERLWNPTLLADEKLSSRVRRLIAQQNRLIARGVDVTPITSRFCEIHVEACFDYIPTYDIDPAAYLM